MQGLLIVSGFVQEQNFIRLHEALLRAAQARGIGLRLCPHDRLLFDAANGAPVVPLPPADFALFWDKDIRLAAQLEQTGLRLFNSAAAIAACDDKLVTHMALAQAGVPQPKTLRVPTTYPHVGYGDMSFLGAAIAYLGLPLIIKECRGSFGAQVYLAQSQGEAEAILRAHEASPMLLQQFVAHSAGRDMRLYVVGGAVLAAIQRRNTKDFRANISNGGEAFAYTPTEAERALALRAAQLLGLDFAGVDLLYGEEGPLLCEVNSNAHFCGLAQATGCDIAGGILRHVQNELACPRPAPARYRKEL
ncbi:MAG: RimK family alpha-L-glutamate ligase [Christensenellaceae bacterium]|jgi:RimK family alpha-L-glutamate ligase|nr:RimK family alpha-L-glutamate ligase [Christensenellaceae bacterium]